MTPELARRRRLAALAVAVPVALVGATHATAPAQAALPLTARPPALTPHVLPQPEGWRVELVHLAEDGAVLGRGFPSGTWVEHEPTYVLAWGGDLHLRNLGLGAPIDIEAQQVAFNRDQRGYRVGLDGSGGALPLPSGAVSSSVADLDTAGNAVGVAADASGRSRAVLWPVTGGVRDLAVPGDGIAVLHLADDGTVLGSTGTVGRRSMWRRDRAGDVTPLLRRPGRPAKGVVPAPTGYESGAWRISPSGTALVYVDVHEAPGEYWEQQVVWTLRKGDIARFDDVSTGSMGGVPMDVNDAGIVVGCLLDEWWDDDVTFRWHPTRGLIGKREMGCMTSVNAAGDSVGSGYFNGRLWRWRGTGQQELTVQGQQFLSAAQINDAGLVAAEDRTDHSAFEFRLVLWR